MSASLKLPSGYSLVCLDQIDSTNAEALRRAEKSAIDKLWIVARHQSQGRGRRGRKWITEPGNLFATLLLNWKGPTSAMGQLSFVCAVACADLLEKLSKKPQKPVKVSLKWPNDILLNDAKVGGVLIETSSAGAETTAVAIGFGINVKSHPTEEVSYPTTNFASQGIVLTSDDVFEHLAFCFDHYLAIWQGGDNFASIKQRWLEFGPSIGQALKVNTGAEVVEGTFAGLDDCGGLQLKQFDGSLHTVLAGDVIAEKDTRL